MAGQSRIAAAIGLLFALLAGGCGATPPVGMSGPSPKPVAAAPPVAAPSPPEEHAQPGHHHDAELVALPDGVQPQRPRIAAVGVDADVIELGLGADQTLEVPQNFAQAGWFTGGPRPGRLGAAVIAGHVDSREGPAVFYRLRDLRTGDGIEVVGTSGEAARFAVERVQAPRTRSRPSRCTATPAPPHSG